jgi:serine/threonine-protein kinase HipA
MSRAPNRCLACLEAITGGETDFHSRCARSFFGTPKAPAFEYGLADMEKLATRVLRSHSAVPGVQSKISVDMDPKGGEGKAGRLTLVGIRGRFTLKPQTARFPYLPVLEDATMRLARAAGIPTVPHVLIRLASGELAYLTRRIDRTPAGKIAMEDLCQASGRLTEDKYKGSLEQAGRVLRGFSTQAGLDAVNFFELAVFCFLTGNADMHLKNFSMWRPFPDEVQFAPAYDLLATKLLLAKEEEETALTLNGKKKNLGRKDFDALAASLQMNGKARDNAFSRLFGMREEWSAILEKCLLPPALRERYGDLVAQRMARLKGRTRA